ncbi:MAG: cadherin-like domain-containing protein, partial [Anaerolineales bacterium]|nr:cadherin-like domain-containing protein [Anaerolineales bacterium]
LALNSSGQPVVAFQDGANDYKATVMRYDGSSWQTVGSAGFSGDYASYTSLALDSSDNPVVAFSDDDNDEEATVMRYDGSSWQTVGDPGFSAGEVSNVSLALDSSGNPVVAFRIDDTTTKPAVNGRAIGWRAVADCGQPRHFSREAGYVSLVLDSSDRPVVAFVDWGLDGKATVMRYDGSSWQTVGSAGFSGGETDYTSLALDSSDNPVVAFQDDDNGDKATVMRFEGGPVRLVTMSEDGAPTPFALTLEAVDPNGDPLTWSISRQAGHGTASASGTGTSKAIGYSPDADYNGSDSFVVQVADSDGLTGTLTISVTIEAQPDAPLAVDDRLMVRRDDSGDLSILTSAVVTIPVLLNDSDPLDGVTDSTGLTLSAVGTASQGGAVALNANNLWVDYTPTTAFTGTETFTYTMSDGSLSEHGYR